MLKSTITLLSSLPDLSPAYYIALLNSIMLVHQFILYEDEAGALSMESDDLVLVCRNPAAAHEAHAVATGTIAHIPGPSLAPLPAKPEDRVEIISDSAGRQLASPSLSCVSDPMSEGGWHGWGIVEEEVYGPQGDDKEDDQLPAISVEDTRGCWGWHNGWGWAAAEAAKRAKHRSETVESPAGSCASSSGDETEVCF